MKSLIKPREVVNPKVIEKAYEHATQEYPKEAVGLVYGGRYVKAVNIHEEPEKSWRIDPKTIKWDKLTAIIHNHPEGDLWPTRADMDSHLRVGVPYGIFKSHKSAHEVSHSILVWLDSKYHDYEYEGRPFINGITDCYSLIRDFYYKEMNIDMGDYPRDVDWFDPSYPERLNLYEDNFAKEGFKPIKVEDLQRGDVLLMRMYWGKVQNEPPVNHGAIYLGDDKLLHHLPGRLSSIDSASKWINRYLYKAIRINKKSKKIKWINPE